jgi:hypothetical protein
MNVPECSHESAVLAADRCGEWDQALRAHADACSNCQDALLVTRFLIEEAEQAPANAHIPPAGLIWWKAQIQFRREAEVRAGRPIEFAERIAIILLGLVLPILLVVFGPKTSMWTSCAVVMFVGGLVVLAAAPLLRRLTGNR